MNLIDLLFWPFGVLVDGLCLVWDLLMRFDRWNKKRLSRPQIRVPAEHVWALMPNYCSPGSLPLNELARSMRKGAATGDKASG